MKNEIIISVLLFAYFAFFAPEPQQTEQKTATTTAQTDVVKPQEKAPVALPDSVLQQQLGSLAPLANGQEKEYVLENKDLKITFSTLLMNVPIGSNYR